MKWVLNNFDTIWALTLTHVWLSIPPIVLGFVISIPFGWFAARYRVSRGVILTILGLLYTIPSLALFIVMPAVLGTGFLDPVNVVVALTIYAVALMVRSIADGLGSVDHGVIGSATAVGYGPFRRFWTVEFPLAGPVMLAGLRVVSVSTVSLVSIGSAIGVSSLGNLFLDGLRRNIPEEVWSGILATLVIAIVFDVILVLAGRILMPWSRGKSRSRRDETERAILTAVTE